MTSQILALVSMCILLVALILIFAKTSKAKKHILMQAQTMEKNSGAPLDEQAQQTLMGKYRANVNLAFKQGAIVAAVGLVVGIVAIIIKYAA